MVHQNSPTVEFWQEKIEGNLRRANTEPSVDFRRANTEPSVDFRKANTELSVHFRRANTETPRSSPASPRKTPSFPPLLLRLTHAVNTLQREGEHLGVEGSILEIIRPVLELVLVIWALDRDSNTFFLHPDILATQVLS